jgi:hypothetical protein
MTGKRFEPPRFTFRSCAQKPAKIKVIKGVSNQIKVDQEMGAYTQPTNRTIQPSKNPHIHSLCYLRPSAKASSDGGFASVHSRSAPRLRSVGEGGIQNVTKRTHFRFRDFTLWISCLCSISPSSASEKRTHFAPALSRLCAFPTYSNPCGGPPAAKTRNPKLRTWEFSLKALVGCPTFVTVRAHGMWTYEPRQGRKAATVVCSTSAVVTLAFFSMQNEKLKIKKARFSGSTLVFLSDF